jgi:hypothetical protein
MIDLGAMTIPERQAALVAAARRVLCPIGLIRPTRLRRRGGQVSPIGPGRPQ